ncbi:hypothetical protein JTB14_006390 [Gonioctena quinquepunctata]|nr:hypothetical protein JTB14_006390 [Gonioctena quinquepunctata]
MNISLQNIIPVLTSSHGHSGEAGQEEKPQGGRFNFSIITFAYMFPIFRKSFKKELADNDVYDVLPNFTSRKLGNILEREWKKQRMKKNPSLLAVLFKCFAKRYLLLGLMELTVQICLTIAQPVAMSKFVAYFQPDQTTITKSDLYMYTALVIGLKLFTTLYNPVYYQLLAEEGIKLRTALTSLIYRQALSISSNDLSEFTPGKIVTYVTKDVFVFEQVMLHLNDLWIGAIQVIVTCYLLYKYVGFSLFAGITFLIIVLVVQCFIGKMASNMRIKSARCTDERIQTTMETISAIKILKMFSWEDYFEKKINDLRKSELQRLAPIYYLRCIVLILGSLSANISLFLIIITSVWTGFVLDAERLYFLRSSFNTINRFFLALVPLIIAQGSEVHASLKRLERFMRKKGVDQYRKTSSNPRVYLNQVSVKVKQSRVLKNISLLAENGLFLITGSVGSGKTSLLRTIIGDYTIDSGSLVVNGDISYASENPWVFPGTIRQNILFGQEYDEKRYNDVLKVVRLKFDIDKLQEGDETLVRDMGSNLSKGQQARINLARAVYRNSDIYLLDNCLTHLDNQTSLYVLKKCIMEYLKRKIVFLVTSNMEHVKLVDGDNTLFLDGGKVVPFEKINTTLDKKVAQNINETNTCHSTSDARAIDQNDNNRISEETSKLLKSKKEDNTGNIYHEKKSSGTVALGVYLRYYRFSGGIISLFLIIATFIAVQFTNSSGEKLISEWVNMEPIVSELIMSNRTSTEDYIETVEKRDSYMIYYCIYATSTCVLTLLKTYITFYFLLKTAKNLHQVIIHSVMNAFLAFFDEHYIGNIINRFSKDMSIIDEKIPLIFYETLKGILQLFGMIILMASVKPVFIVAFGIPLIMMIIVQRIYGKSGRSIQRLETGRRSPMIGHIKATFDGITTVRAFGLQSQAIEEFDKHQDQFTSANFLMTASLKTLDLFNGLINTIFISSVVLNFVFFDTGSKAGDVGLAVSQAISLTMLLGYVLMQVTEFENYMTATERVLEYTDISTENRQCGQVIEDWPGEGKIEYQDLSLTYGLMDKNVLKSLSFVINPGEKIGIVGRTGAGKSSIISVLFRLYKVEGEILVDDVNIKNLSLENLRSKISVIPQDPLLFSGTIRSNIDPTEQYSDEAIWKALEEVGMKYLISDLREKVTDNGTQFSSGQKQLLCLARAFMNNNKIIVLDESTASMDSETCRLVHDTMKHKFSHCTVLAIAHRLNTVLDADRVMVIGDGEIIEFDDPNVLLANEEGAFRSMIGQASHLNESRNC